ncbi:MAG: lactoylglutathione lyase [Zetaproteobacteria bacterium CG2_30_46_52]|nr:MAG: lactoylglutathione lyase [Zetaproteobacteria bacterium CG2_30_46_52]
MSNAVGWFEIYVDDINRAQDFYEAVFDVKLEKLAGMDMEMLTFPMNPETYGAPGALVKMPGFPSGGNSVLVYFSCADCGVSAEKAKQAGGEIQKAKMSLGENGFMALVTDTEGNMLGLHSMA